MDSYTYRTENWSDVCTLGVRDVKYNAMSSLDLVRRQDTRNWLGYENYCENEAERATDLKLTEIKVL